MFHQINEASASRLYDCSKRQSSAYLVNKLPISHVAVALHEEVCHLLWLLMQDPMALPSSLISMPLGSALEENLQQPWQAA